MIRRFETTVRRERLDKEGDPCRSLSINARRRLYWAEERRRVAKWRHRVWLAWQSQGSLPIETPVRVTFTIRRSRRVDDGAAHEAMKPLLDGLVGLGVRGAPTGGLLPDDTAQYVAEVRVRQEIAPVWKNREEIHLLVETVEDPECPRSGSPHPS